MTLAQTLSLPDGRVLSFRAQGDAAGYPVFYLHGIPGSKQEPFLPADTETLSGIRLITMDRPGYGGSSPCEHYDVTTHSADLCALADHLEIGRFALFGFSGGGFYALNSAHQLGERVSRVVLVGTPAIPLLPDPLNEAGELTASTWQQARDNPETLPDQLRPLVSDAQGLAETLLQALSSADRELFADPHHFACHQDNMSTAVQQGAKAAAIAIARDMTLMMQPWPWDSARLPQAVHIFHGTSDGLLSTQHAQALAEAISHSQLELGEGEGHYAGICGSRLRDLCLQALPQ
ncbi:alpha/beta fold hydrolase [Marinimicrobium agarilyticum]|uniref:alpha/beta fold hydrolase n=1 Tax=Marinimicrobium agarilyticum TaxID=306546 RepID=UPI0003F53FA7|nr:alpha/beta hydrolase [Marinimicrobium agarilyticum]